ncbi:MAG: hypothetical protein GFH27_549309n113 [Chloroflexi bacterium AL-W]|nr:hypothetical protein [Chloroflexi bacterium AL-N1]NOK69815.1 hypothetical protein [Chloroflexi bacterium AL-N10]NOK73581.1 hypothetical protein [Chloroflexi bacterium AL-N5]NOK83985.1 hypothetical protein [Chloroflexi bacterium AL-W]NOK87912.1 hypothetical protein [Chloroflexi bacterium AL-N15]
MNQLRRKFHLFILALVFAFSSSLAIVVVPSIAAAGPCVAGPHSGVINTDQSWCVASSPHVVTSTVTVADGVTLTIEPGVVIRLSGANTSIIVNGTLDAQGTAANGILFTTNNVSPASGQWKQLVFNVSSNANVLDYVTVEYGGYFDPAIDVRTDDLTISNSVVRNNDQIGLQINDASPTISTTSFTNNASRAIDLNGASLPTLSDLSASGNGFNGATINGTTINADYVWGEGIGNYLVTNDVVVANGTTLSIVPGTTVRLFGAETQLIVNGSLRVPGTADDPILFTSAQETPAPGQWNQIVFNAVSSDNLLDYVTVEYAGYFAPAIDVRTDDLTISNSVVRNNDQVGLQINDASPTISTTSFTNNTSHAIDLNGASFPVFSDLSASGNGFNGVVINGSTITNDYAWGEGISNYLMTSNVTVNPDTTLTVVPGTTVRVFGAATQLIVNGTLTAVGTADDPILFTSAQETPAPSQWKQIIFNPSSRNSSLEYVTVEYGGYFDPVIAIASTSVSIRKSTVARNGGDGIEVSAGSPVITNNNIVANADFGLRNTSSGTVRATCNWWGAESGPTNAANPGGVGQRVSNNVIFDPWLTTEAPDDTCSSGSGGGGLVVYLPLVIR